MYPYIVLCQVCVFQRDQVRGRSGAGQSTMFVTGGNLLLEMTTCMGYKTDLQGCMIKVCEKGKQIFIAF